MANYVQKTKKAIMSTVAGALALYSTGCASYNINPVMNARTDDAGNLETKVGIAFTGKASENPEYHGGVLRETGQTLLGPFHIYRAADKKWLPEWREHTLRTAGVSVIYIALMAAGGSGGGSSGGSSSDGSALPPKSVGDDYVAPKDPVTPPVDDGGHVSGD